MGIDQELVNRVSHLESAINLMGSENQRYVEGLTSSSRMLEQIRDALLGTMAGKLGLLQEHQQMLARLSQIEATLSQLNSIGSTSLSTFREEIRANIAKIKEDLISVQEETTDTRNKKFMIRGAIIVVAIIWPIIYDVVKDYMAGGKEKPAVVQTSK